MMPEYLPGMGATPQAPDSAASAGEPIVEATSLSSVHDFGKRAQPSILLVAGHGVKGDAHAGATTQHLYLKRKTPGKPNLTQVHLLHAEAADLFHLAPGELGENLLTRHLDLHALPTGTVLRMGEATLQITGFRTPCSQIDKARPGLLKQVFVGKRPNAGIMAIVLTTGEVRPGDRIAVTLPPPPHRPLGPV